MNEIVFVQQLFIYLNTIKQTLKSLMIVTIFVTIALIKDKQQQF